MIEFRGACLDSRELTIPRVKTDPLGHPTPAGYKLWADWAWPWFTLRLQEWQTYTP